MAALVSKCFTRQSWLGLGGLRAALPSLADANKPISRGYVKEGNIGSKFGSVQLGGVSQGHGEPATREYAPSWVDCIRFPGSEVLTHGHTSSCVH